MSTHEMTQQEIENQIAELTAQLKVGKQSSLDELIEASNSALQAVIDFINKNQSHNLDHSKLLTFKVSKKRVTGDGSTSKECPVEYGLRKQRKWASKEFLQFLNKNPKVKTFESAIAKFNKDYNKNLAPSTTNSQSSYEYAKDFFELPSRDEVLKIQREHYNW